MKEKITAKGILGIIGTVLAAPIALPAMAGVAVAGTAVAAAAAPVVAPIAAEASLSIVSDMIETI